MNTTSQDRAAWDRSGQARKRRAIFFLLLLAWAGLRPAGAGLPELLIVPRGAETNAPPYGAGTLAAANLRVQLAYGGANFPVTGALVITEIHFRPDHVYGRAFTSTVASLRIDLSTTASNPEAMRSAFSQNVGSDNTTVFNGPITLSSQFLGPANGPKEFDIVIPLSTPFVYAPGLGSLLVDVRSISGGDVSGLSGAIASGDAAGRVVGSVAGASGSPGGAADALRLKYFPTNSPPLPPPRIVRGPYLQSATRSNITVCWRTDRDSDGRVQYGRDAGALTAEIIDPVVASTHFVTLTNLEADTRYFYAVGNTETNFIGGPDCQFTTLHPPGRSTRIWVMGDAGTGNQPGQFGALQVRDAYQAYAGDRATDVWLLLGDNAYYSGTDGEYQDAVFNVYTNLLRRTAMWPTIGNHDARFVGEFPYMDIFHLPRYGEAGGVPSGVENYYSFDAGNIHFVCLDSEVSDRTNGSTMLTWLENDLAANTNDWLIAFWHSPPYNWGTHDSDNIFDSAGRLVDMRENAVPLLESYGVDLVLCGHSHSYERSFLIDGHYGYSDSMVPTMIKDAGSGRPDDTGAYRKAGAGPTPHEGAVYVVCGSSGWVTPDVRNYPGLHPAMFIKRKQLGSMVIDVSSNRLDAIFLRETGGIDDRFTILKGAAPEPLRIATFRMQEGVMTAQWKSLAGRTYRLEESLSLESPDWQPVEEAGEIMATGATTSWIGPVAGDAGGRFFRVVAINP